jgi:hypothetical protein
VLTGELDTVSTPLAWQRLEPELAASKLTRLEVVRTAIFEPANELVSVLLQAAADRIDLAYQPKPGEECKGRVTVGVNGIFGSFN